MATIIKASDKPTALHGVAFNLDDMATKANQYLADVKKQGEALVAKAKQEAEAIRKKAEADGRKAAEQAAQKKMEQTVSQKLKTAQPAIEAAVKELAASRQAWIQQWEKNAVHLAAAIAARVLRKELEKQPEITLGYVREALELCTGATGVRIGLNPSDVQVLGQQVKQMCREFSRLAECEIVPDPAVGAGGCRLETKFGEIDQTIEAQLARIEEELSL